MISRRYSAGFARVQHWTALEETSCDGEADKQSDSKWQLVAGLHGVVAQTIFAAVGVGACRT